MGTSCGPFIYLRHLSKFKSTTHDGIQEFLKVTVWKSNKVTPKRFLSIQLQYYIYCGEQAAILKILQSAHGNIEHFSSFKITPGDFPTNKKDRLRFP